MAIRFISSLMNKEEYKKELLSLMNPLPKDKFNPDDFEPLGEEAKKINFRKRVNPPKLLPTCGLKPKEVLEGQMIGMFETKQDLYLIFAHKCNELQKQIDELKKKK